MDRAFGTRMTINSYRDLDVWIVAMDLVDRVLTDLKAMPRVEFDLRRQIQRAVISIPSNVAEGWRRKKRKPAYQNHVSIAMGSHGELDTELEICFRNDLLRRDDCREALSLLSRVGPMLNRLHDSLD
jgi:four helix bundle protein